MEDSYVALVRGINVGRAKRVAMADLRALVERLGYRDVRTVLNSGNVIFGAPRGTEPGEAAARIPESLARGPGVAYLWCPDGILASRLADAVSRALGDGVTTRNWATMTKLHAHVARER